jgi:hypothetical protein
MKALSVAGVSGKVQVIQHSRASGLSFEDLFERRDGKWVNKMASKTVVDREDRNKVLLRGLAYHLHALLSGHVSGGPYVPSQITSEPTKNPYAALYVMGDWDDSGGGGTNYIADAKPDWDESNGTYNSNVPPNPGIAGLGMRAVLHSDTVGPGLKRISIAYPTTAPYREIEYTYFAQANVPAYATGSITFVGGATHADAETFTISDGVNPPLTFELDSDSSVTAWDGDPANNIPIVFAGSETADQMRDLAIDQVNRVMDYMSLNRYSAKHGAGLLITASAGGTGVMSLSHQPGGEIGNTTISVSTSPVFSGSKVDFTGGSDANNLEKTDDGIDNLPIKSVGLAAGVQCGDGEADAKTATRSVTGLAATVQGISDRVYQHEGTGLYSYSGSDNIGTNGAGYHASSEQEESLRSIATNAADSVDSTSKRIVMKNGAFTIADVGRGFKFTSGTNTGTKTINKVVDKWTIVVAETVSTEGSGFTGDVVHPATGDKAFDGDVDSEGDTGVMDLGEKWRSVTGTGPHTLARVWATSQSIRGVRIIGPAGVPKDYYPNTFKVQKLATTAQGNPLGPATEDALEPANDNHWIDVGAEVDFTSSGKGDEIFDGAEKGYEFLFNSNTTTRGIRLTQMQAVTSTYDVQIAEFLIFGELAAITFSDGVDDGMRFATDGVPTGPGTPGTEGTYRAFAMGDLTTSGDITQNDVQDVADWLNKQLRGYGLEALRSDLGRLWIRSTVSGDKVQMDTDSLANGSTALTKLGLGTAVIQKTGRTEVIFKVPGDALTIIYRYNISGDLPVA